MNKNILAVKLKLDHKISTLFASYNTMRLVSIRKYLEYLKLSKEFYQSNQEKLKEGSLKLRYYKRLVSSFDKKITKKSKKLDKLTNKMSKINNRIENIVEIEYKLYKEEISRLKEILSGKNRNSKHDAKITKKIELLQTKIYLIDDWINLKNNPNMHLTISNLTMKFGGLKAVDNLSFSVNKGEIFGLIGPNGAGKTTVFNCITQFYKPVIGEIFFQDRFEQIQRLSKFKVHNVVSLGLARTFQNVELVWELSVLENLLIGAHSLLNSNLFDSLFRTPRLLREEKILRQKAQAILARLNLSEYQFAYPASLPYGVLKKVELARSLMTNPSLIILDEPAAGLNDNETKELAATIVRLKEEFNVTIVLVEHDMDLVMNVCDRICAISFGQQLAIGTPAEIKKNPVVQEAYLGGNIDE